MAQDALPPAIQLRQLLWGHMVTQALAVVARLGVADVLAEGPMTSADLAARVGADDDALYRMMRALASLGVFDEVTPRTFGQSPLSDHLREDAKPSLRHLALLNAGQIFRWWGNALETAKTGKTAVTLEHGTTYYEFMEEHPAESALFNNAMAGAVGQFLSVLSAVDWSGVHRVVDVGGGNGTLLIGLVSRFPSLEGVVFDLPQVAQAAREKLEASPVAGRCTFQAGSFLEEALPKGDAYILARVLHNWDDARAATILGNCRASIAPGGRLFIIDEILREGNAPQPGKLMDLQMLVVGGGRERTQREWETLLGAAGFGTTSFSPGGLIEARA